MWQWKERTLRLSSFRLHIPALEMYGLLRVILIVISTYVCNHRQAKDEFDETDDAREKLP